MRYKHGIEIDSIAPGSVAEKSGLLPGDVVLSINDHPLRDVIDFMYYMSSDDINLEFKRNGSKYSVHISKHGDLGLALKPFKIKTCRNNCLFCFVKQLPRGLRKSLYVKDEDYRMSFLYGNYISISNLDNAEKKRIMEQRLSPLYISVHTTNRTLRNKMLGNPRASDIMKELKFFSDRKIRMHTQIVLCPGYNDKQELQNTIKDIYKFYPYTSSIAVVPVGLTMHRKSPLNPVTEEDASRAISIVEAFQRRFKKKHGDPIVYCADEMYIKAGLPFPKLRDYGALPQLENGVGMVPLFLSQTKKIRITTPVSPRKKFLALTGMSFYPFIKKFIDRLRERDNVHIEVIGIENKFFGPSVTVTGLLTGRDIIKSLHENSKSYDILIVPGTMMKEDADIFLDDVSLRDVEDAIGLPTIRTIDTPQGLIDAMQMACR